MRQLLETKHARLAATLDGNYPQLKASVWHSEASQQSAVQTLTPQMTENKAKVRRRRRPSSFRVPQAVNPTAVSCAMVVVCCPPHASLQPAA